MSPGHGRKTIALIASKGEGMAGLFIMGGLLVAGIVAITVFKIRMRRAESRRWADTK